MTAVAMRTVVPALAPLPRSENRPAARHGNRGPLPLPTLVGPRARSTVYGLARVDDRGRVADHAIVRAMGWLPGVRLDIRQTGGLILVRVSGQGVFTVTGQGHVRLPATVRRWCHLEPGDRVLLTGEPADGLLVVHPPAALDAMLTRFHEQALGGDLA